MALIKCTECGKEFSDKASNCPHCGCPIEEVKGAMKEQEQLEEKKKAEKELKRAEKESKTKKEILPEQKKKMAIIGVVAVVVVIVAVILVWYYGVKVPRDRAFATYSETVTSYNSSIDAYNQSVEGFNTTANEIIELNDSYTGVIDEAQALIDSGETPYEAEKLTTLSNTLKDARNNKTATPSLYEKRDSYTLDETLAKTSAKKIDEMTAALTTDKTAIDDETTTVDTEASGLRVPDYSSTISTIEKQQQELADSYKIQQQITNPTQDWVLARLDKVDNVANTACATEENDPNGHLGKDGGYTAQIYFSSTLLGTQAVAGDKLIDAGTVVGGSVEVYKTVEEAETRNSYLAGFDGGIFDSGKHIVVGTMVVRISDDLTASKQEQFANEIIAALIEL